jgi:bacteriocin-like protein
MVRAALMEKIMSNSNDTFRELTSNELDAVSGGAFPLYWFLSSTVSGERVDHGDFSIVKHIDKASP